MKAPAGVPRIRDYLLMLGRAWLLILVATVVSAGAAVAAVELRKPTYSASASVFAVVAGDSGVIATYFGGLGANSRMPTYADLAKSRLVAQRTVTALDLPITPEDLMERTSAQWEPGGTNPWGRATSALLRVTVTGSDPDTVVEEVNGVAGSLIAVSRELEWHESKVTDEIQYKGAAAELVPVDAATTAQRVRKPILTTLSIGAGVGLAFSTLLLLAVEIARDTVATRGQLKHIVKRATQATQTTT